MAMFSSKKYLPIVAAFVVGASSAVGFAVHAQTPSVSLSAQPQVQATAQDPQQPDGETADDAANTTADIQVGHQDATDSGVETPDTSESATEVTDGGKTSQSITHASETESETSETGSDVGESETTQ